GPAGRSDVRIEHRADDGDHHEGDGDLDQTQPALITPDPLATLTHDSHASVAYDVDVHPAVSRPIQLGEDQALVLTQHRLTVRHRDGDATPEERRAQMGVGVAAVAVGVTGVVVEIAVPTGDESLQ